MISLSSARDLVEKVRKEELPVVYTDLTLHEWIRKGVISHMKVENGKALYPDIVATEILTALRLKEHYNLEEIAEARRCLEFEGGHLNQISEEEIIRFINCRKLLKDKELVTKMSINRIDSLDHIKELVDDLIKEKNHLEVVEDYLREFLKAEKELKKEIMKKEMQYVS